MKKAKDPRGRKRWTSLLYFWFSEKNGRRISWFFPSKKRALEWRDHQFWRYARYPELEDFLASVDRNHKREEEWWYMAKEYYEEITLEKARAEYMGDKFKDPNLPWNVNRTGSGFI